MGFHASPKLPPQTVASSGPVTRALRAMHAADAEHRAEVEAERARIRTLRLAISNRIEADIALLDTLDAITEDLEDGGDDEPSLGGPNPIPQSVIAEITRGLIMFDGLDQRGWACGADDDREFGDDNGIADPMGLAEQEGRHLAAGGRLRSLRGRS